MSWQAYIDVNLLGTQKIVQAAIYGHNETLWATSKGFSISSTEIKTILKGFDEPQGIQANGFLINGVKYFTILANSRSIYGKQLANGIVAVKTKQAVIIGMYVEGTQPGEAALIVEKLADYLISANY
ncbi:hypothetical protein G9A89_012877 [Geosiphon pyriformis]|nr:hypothetical protein G9A89_012877 [Geosiphon pyriformis]